MGKMDSTKGAKSVTGATPPKGAVSSDKSGERMERMVGGVAMGKEDKTLGDKQFNLYAASISQYRTLAFAYQNISRRFNLIVNYTLSSAATWGCVLGELFDLPGIAPRLISLLASVHLEERVPVLGCDRLGDALEDLLP